MEEEEFEGFPSRLLTIPGSTINTVDGKSVYYDFEAFVHAPFKEDSYGGRNDCSIALQITLKSGNGIGQALLMGDLQYPIIRKIFNRSDKSTLCWNVLLAPHHCSKSAMYWKDEGEEEGTLKSDIIRDIGNVPLTPGYIVSSSEAIPNSNEPGDNPPHAVAKVEYERIVPNEFLCTHEHLSLIHISEPTRPY